MLYFDFPNQVLFVVMVYTGMEEVSIAAPLAKLVFFCPLLPLQVFLVVQRVVVG